MLAQVVNETPDIPSFAGRLRQAARREATVNWTFWLAAFGFVNWVNYRFLLHIEPERFHELGWVFAIAELHMLLLAGALALIGALIDDLRHPLPRRAFDGLCVFCVVAYYADLLLFGMLNTHLVPALLTNLQGGAAQFVLMLKTCGIEHRKLWLCGALALLVPVAGAVLGEITRRLSNRLPLRAPRGHLGLALAAGALALLAAQWTARSQLSLQTWFRQQEVMPLHVSLFELPQGVVPWRAELVPPRDRPALDAALGSVSFAPQPRRDVFLFVLESVREDFLTPEIAPNLHRIKQEALVFDEFLASANTTHFSWFSLVTANQPFYFRLLKHREELWGSVPVRLFRQAGYEVHVISASRLDWHGFDRLVLGPRRELADTFVLTDAAPEGDRQVNRLLRERFITPGAPPGRLFLVFHESTHFDYDWPADHPAPFKPYAESIRYEDAGDMELAPMINRYKNSLHYVDSLFGEFIAMLKAAGRYEDAIIAVTSDHGEEFREHGHMIHSTDLNPVQTRAVYLLKAPSAELARFPERRLGPLGGHLDVMPTLLDLIGLRGDTSALFDGKSALRAREPFALTVAHDWQRDPYRFFVHNGRRKAFFQFKKGSLIDERPVLYLSKITDAEDRPVAMPAGAEAIRRLVESEFAAGMSCLRLRQTGGVGSASPVAAR